MSSKNLNRKIKKKTIKKKKKIILNLREKYISDYSKLNNSQLGTETEKIVDLLSKSQKLDEEQIDDLEIQLESIKYIIDKKSINQSFNNRDYGYYPDFDDKDFNKKIFLKKEFNLNKIPFTQIPKKDNILQLEDISQKMCSREDDMTLNPNQNFLKTYLSPLTPYNSLLLFHGTGVGKTCSSISIVEEFSQELLEYNKKIIILSNPSIKSNFMKNIFNINSVKAGRPLYQCTKDKYFKLLNIDPKDVGKKISYSDFQIKINKKISEKYEFYGYQEFANKIQKIIDKSKSFKPNLRKKYLKDKILERFSNCAMIIDEAHNIKQGDDMKKVPPILEKILRYSENMKLVLLSATPMFDNSTEIVWLLNLLLMNDKRPLISDKMLFNKGNLTKEGKELLIKKSRGYISYLRGENIMKFPKRLYPSVYDGKPGFPSVIKNKDFPKNDLSGKKIEEKEKIQTLEIIGCEMKGHQLDYYNKMVENNDYGSFLSNGLMISNIVFPSISDSNTLSSISGNSGFNHTFSKVRNQGQLSFKFKNDVFKDMFKLENLKNYSSKIANIVENVKSSEGIIFIYSKYIYSGIVPLALALEYNGFEHYKAPLLQGDKMKPVMVGKNKAKYMIISGTPDLGRNAYDDYLKIENKNKNGEMIKIILGTETAAEGLDFSNIREVHILDPWYHLNKLEQIIGRGIRYCSHIDLPIEKRNVVVNLYAATNKNISKDDDIETVDLRVLREAENKGRQMGEVEYILKMNAIDCNLNIYGNKFTHNVYNGYLNLTTPKNTKPKNITIKDKDYDRLCSYNKCDYKCLPDLSMHQNKNEINYDTFNQQSVKEQTHVLKKQIIKMFKEDVIYDINDFMLRFPDEDVNIIYITLQSLIENKDKFMDSYSNTGYLIYKNGYYIFQPLYLKNHKVNINNIRRPLTKKKKGINLTNYISSAKNNKLKKELSPEIIISNIRHNYYFLIRDSLGRDELWLEAYNEVNTEDNDYTEEVIDSYIFFVFGVNFKTSDINIDIGNYLSKKLKKNIYNYGFSLETLYFLERFLSKKDIKKAPPDGWKIKIDETEEFKLELAYNKNLMKKQSLNPLKYMENLLLQCEIDWLPFYEKNILIKHLILNHTENEDLHDIIEKNNLLYNSDVYYKDPVLKSKNENDLYGYKICKNKKLVYYKYDNGDFIECNKPETVQIKKSLRKKLAEETFIVMDKLGYLEEKLPEKKVVLKIRDTEGQGKKGTQKRTGSICGSDGMKKGIITKYLGSFDNNDYADYSKQNLCILIELYLRVNNRRKLLGKEQHRFYNIEEMLEYGIY